MDEDVAEEATDDPKEPHTVTGFLEYHHRLFTVIGVFAGLSVYLSSLGKNGSIGVKMGVSASLMLFFISVGVGVWRTRLVTAKVRKQLTFKSMARTLPFRAIEFSLMFLSAAILNIMWTRYSDEVGGILTSALITAFSFGYWTFVTDILRFDKRDSHTIIGRAYITVPHQALIVTAGWAYWMIMSVGMTNPVSTTYSALVAQVIVSIFIHFLASLVVFRLLIGLDAGVHRIQNWWDSDTPPPA